MTAKEQSEIVNGILKEFPEEEARRKLAILGVDERSREQLIGLHFHDKPIGDIVEES